MRFSYTLTQEAQNRVWAATGKRSLSNIIEIPDEQATVEQRQQYLQLQETEKRLNVLFPPTLTLIGSFQLQSYGAVRVLPLDAVPTLEQVWEIVDQMLASAPTFQEQASAHKALLEQEYQKRVAELKRRNAELAEKAELLRLERDRQAQEAIAKASHIVYNQDGTTVIDLLETLFILSNDEQDDRFHNWAKHVTGIGQQENGYGFLGEFVPQGTIEIARQRRVYLVASTQGSRKHNTTTYRVMLMSDEGQITCTDIHTTNSKPGWALRLRDQVKALLEG